ncbi:acetyltransferase [Porphyrobacter sp. GA68]|uniref:N-acyl amino acid synthase FeeM domain-containing protein n=1 Tax=Porphyrobacter sp. GA68 TaxID=2883480 RepID=UPI001D19078D|nr:acetyltransferase [Porphyrobacter sp. GA68]
MIETTRNRRGEEARLSTPPTGLRLYEGTVQDERRGSQTSFAIELAATAEQKQAACALVNAKYGWRGYGNDHRLSDSLTSTTFSATLEQDIVGTLSLVVDSPSGLSADHTFGDTLQLLRAAPDTRLCELTKFAFDSDFNSMHVLASLFHTIFIYGTTRHRCTDLLIEVNPRHIRFYEVMLSFEKVGGLRTNASVDAPSQLMRLKVADIGRHIERHHAGGGAPSKRSLYPFFLTAAQEYLIHERMADFARDWPFSELTSA